MDIRTLCLGLLTLHDASGYEVKKIFQGPLRHFFDAGYGSIYPALNKLADDGLLTCTGQGREKRPEKKVYSITDKGRAAFADELLQPPGRDRFRSEFVATLLFADHLPTQHLSGLIDQWIANYRALIGELEQCCARPSQSVGEKFVNGMGVAVYTAALEYLQANRHQVERDALAARAGQQAANPQATAAE
jgi:PadR family transcriptional regulator, regulatory protein AphA